MSTVGLTENQRTTLALISGHGEAVVVHPRVYAALARKGLVVGRDVTPRGHAALAAPRMTQAEYDGLKWLSTYIVRYAIGHRRRMMRRLSSRGFANFDPFTGDASINDAGRTALNNVRAAIGSPDWKEDV